LLGAFLAIGLQAEPAAWQPAKTWVFAVGILNFDDKTLATWPDKGREDVVFLDTLRQRGVPTEHIVFLKNQEGTKARITSRLTEFLKQPGPDDTFMFYYAGHGSRDYNKDARPVSFVTYDAASDWPIRSVFDEVEANFKGARALLLADCCHSGALADEAGKRHGRVSYGVLTSSHASSQSTGNWTFTESLVDLFRGAPILDENGDGRITFAEAAHYQDHEMAFCENQRADNRATGSITPDFVLATVSGHRADPRVGEYCEGEYQGKWYKAKIIDAANGKYKVTWPGWGHESDSFVTSAQLRPFKPTVPPDGTDLEIGWEKKWYPGSVLRSELGLTLVHYKGYPAADDEWVAPDRLRLK
jgi:hypothetical protein